MKKLTSLLLIFIAIICIPCISYAVPPEQCYYCGGTDCFSSEPDCTKDPFEATCTEPGQDCYICKECGVHNYVSVPALGHVEGIPEKIQQSYSTYITKGQFDTEVHCTVCGDLISSVPGEDPLLEVDSITIALSPNNPIKVGESATATATILPDEPGKPSPEWSIDNCEIAIIDSNGYIIGKSAGDAIITAVAGGKTAIKALKVLPKDDPEPETYQVDVSAGEGGTASAGGTFAKGTLVEIRATPDTGYVFSGWEIGSATFYENPYTITVNSNVTAHAVFTEDPSSGEQFTISTFVAPSTVAGSVTGGGVYNKNERIYLTAYPASGYIFTGWTLNGATVGVSETLPVIVNQSAEYVAHFLKNGSATYTVRYMHGDAEESENYADLKTENLDLRLRDLTYTKKGYVQTGWISKDNTAYPLGGSYKFNSDITLYPKWAVAGKHTLTVYYNASCGNIKTGGTLVKNGDSFKIKDDGSVTFHFTAIPDYYTGSVVLNGVRQYFTDNTFTVSGKGADQTLRVTFYSRYGNPATGDDSNLLLWSCLFGMSAAAVATGVVLKKKNRI